MTHEVLELDTFADGTGYYNEHSHTFLHFFESKTGPSFLGWWFSWWGNPYQDWWPSASWFHQDDLPPLSLEAGEDAVLVLANNVTGYSITILGEDPLPGTARAWALGPNPDMHLLLPSAEGVYIEEGATVAKVRRWSSTVDVPGPSVLMTAAWEHRRGDGLHMSAALDGHGWMAGSVAPPVSVGPSLELEEFRGGRSDHQSTKSSIIADPAPQYTLYRNRDEATFSELVHDEGAQFFVFPYGPLSP